MNQFKPIQLKNRNPANRLWFKGGDPSIDDTEDQKEVARIAGERWDSYIETFVPAENEYINEMLNYDNPQRMEQMSGVAAAGTESAYTEAIMDETKRIKAGGVNPNSGAFNEAIDSYATDSAEARTNNTTRTQQAIQDQKVTGMKNVVAMGNGQATEAISGMNQIAADSADEAIDRATKDFSERQNNFEAAGRLTGTVAHAIKDPEAEQ